MEPKIITILRKDFQILFNSKFSSFIFLAGPLILILLVGGALKDSSIKNINSGLYISDDVPVEFQDLFIKNLQERNFNVLREVSLENCKGDVINGFSNVCIYLKKGELDSFGGIETQQNYDLELYVDFSQQRIVWNIIGAIQAIAEQESRNIRLSTIGDFKEKSEDLQNIILSQESYLNQAITSLDEALVSLNSIQTNQQNAKLYLDATYNKMTALQTELSSLKNSGIEGLDDSLLLISDSISGLNSARSFLDNGVQTSNLRENLESTRAVLLSLKSSLIQINTDLDFLQESDLDNIVNPIQVNYFSVLDETSGKLKGELAFFDYLFPNFIMFFILFSSIIYSATNIIRERRSNSYIRNRASKTKGINFVLSNFLTSVFIVIVQIILIIFVANFFVNISFTSNLFSLILFLLLSISVFCLIGLLIGFIFNSQESAIIASISVSLLFFMFSSLISPIETLPKVLSKIVSLTPFALLETKLRLILIFNTPLNFANVQIFSLGGLIVLLSILTIIVYRNVKEKEI